MDTTVEITRVRRRISRYFFKDGIQELRTGLAFLAIGVPNLLHQLGLRSFENPWVVLSAATLLLAAWPGTRWLRAQSSYPRIGYAKPAPVPPVAYLFAAFIVVATVAALRADIVSVLPWGAEAAIVLLPASVLAMGYTSGLWRFYASGLLLLIGAVVVAAQDLTPYGMLHLQLSITGAVLLISGIITFINFLQEHPAEDEAHVHA